MENLKKFNTQEEYQEWKDGDNYVYPNVCKVGDEVIYNGYPEPFWIEALEDLTFNSERNNLISPYYSYDKLNWNETYRTSRVLRSGQKVYFKSKIRPSNGDSFKLQVSGRFNVGGSLLSIFYDSDYLNYLDYNISGAIKFTAFQNSKVVNAKELVLPPCNKNSFDYLAGLFSDCSLLVSSPRIPKMDNAKTQLMFKNCTSLQEAPTLKGNFYNAAWLFSGCSSLSFIKDLTVGNRISPEGWVEGVSPTGTFIASSKRTDFTRGVNGIPEGWDLYLYDEYNDRYVVKFKVNGIPYEFYTDEPRDITWGEFVESNHNTNGFYIEDNFHTIYTSNGEDRIILNNEYVEAGHKVVLHASYTTGSISL